MRVIEAPLRVIEAPLRVIEAPLRVIEAPLREIVYNAGEEASVVVAVLADKGNYGYNAANGTYSDMIDMGILDPSKVTRTALKTQRL